MTSPPQVFQINGITSGTVMTVSPAASPALAAGTKYSILLSDSLSVDGLAQDIAETFGMYQRNISGFADVMNGTGDVTITVGGQAVTVPGQKSLAKKGVNNDITEIKGLKVPLSMEQGGFGGKNAADLRKNAGLGTAATKDTTESTSDTTIGRITRVADFGIGVPLTFPPADFKFNGFVRWSAAEDEPRQHFSGIQLAWSVAGLEGWQFGRSTGSGVTGALHPGWRRKFGGEVGQWYDFFSTANTTKGSDGSIKAASPVVKLFHDGRYETNDESEGCTVERLAVGEYLITGCMGLNSDAGWSGIDGGFDIPCDRHKRVRIWLDYKVNADGSILVKTYHCIYPDSPEFAQNRIGYKDENGVFTETVKDGQQVDIPADQYLLVRVEMPADSIWNQKQATIQTEAEDHQPEHLEE